MIVIVVVVVVIFFNKCNMREILFNRIVIGMCRVCLH